MLGWVRKSDIAYDISSTFRRDIHFTPIPRPAKARANILSGYVIPSNVPTPLKLNRPLLEQQPVCPIRVKHAALPYDLMCEVDVPRLSVASHPQHYRRHAQQQQQQGHEGGDPATH